jgi:hypothetical protein
VPDEVSTAVTSAPTTPFPEASVTVPPKADEVTPCAKTRTGTARRPTDRRRMNRVKTDFLMKAWFYVANPRATRKKCDFPKLFLNAGDLA